jgi:hypothetical protein
VEGEEEKGNGAAGEMVLRGEKPVKVQGSGKGGGLCWVLGLQRAQGFCPLPGLLWKLSQATISHLPLPPHHTLTLIEGCSLPSVFITIGTIETSHGTVAKATAGIPTVCPHSWCSQGDHLEPR